MEKIRDEILKIKNSDGVSELISVTRSLDPEL